MSFFLASLRKNLTGNSPSLRVALRTAVALLQEKDIDSPRLSSELILARTLGLDRNALLKELLLRPDALLSSYQLHLVDALTARRLKGEPMAYILGRKEFYGREFAVTRATLVPRPETELLVDLALRYANTSTFLQGGVFADFGTGSGCIAVTLALELTNWRGIALDKSPDAVDVACGNARHYRTLNLVCVRADFLYPPVAPASLDMLVSNPPYVSEADYQTLSREIRDFEPKSALVPLPEGTLRYPAPAHRTSAAPARPDASRAGHAQKSFSSTLRKKRQTPQPVPSLPPATGIEDAERVIIRAQQLLKPGGCLFMEIGSTQGEALMQRLDHRLWHSIKVHKDLAGLDRVLAATKSEWFRIAGVLKKLPRA